MILAWQHEQVTTVVQYLDVVHHHFRERAHDSVTVRYSRVELASHRLVAGRCAVV